MSHKNGLGTKRELDFELNLTSFIDLLSTCTCFLLITAVWIQIGTVEIKQSHGTEAIEAKKNSFDLDLVFKTPEELNLNFKQNGKHLKVINVKSENSEAMLLKLNEIIAAQILDKTIAMATVTPRSSVNYGQLISTLDVLRKNHIVNIGILTAKGQ